MEDQGVHRPPDLLQLLIGGFIRPTRSPPRRSVMMKPCCTAQRISTVRQANTTRPALERQNHPLNAGHTKQKHTRITHTHEGPA